MTARAVSAETIATVRSGNTAVVLREAKLDEDGRPAVIMSIERGGAKIAAVTLTESPYGIFRREIEHAWSVFDLPQAAARDTALERANAVPRTKHGVRQLDHLRPPGVPRGRTIP